MFLPRHYAHFEVKTVSLNLHPSLLRESVSYNNENYEY
jgi:hypothetical protein